MRPYNVVVFYCMINAKGEIRMKEKEFSVRPPKAKKQKRQRRDDEKMERKRRRDKSPKSHALEHQQDRKQR